jgi:hypothetical protein
MAKSNQELTDALSAPLGEFISSIAKGVADAQQAMDMNTIETFRSVYMDDQDTLEELRQLGYQPTWYRIPELTAEIQMALSINATALETGNQPGNGRANKFALLAAPVDASYVNSYNYNIQGSSKVKFTIVPVPPSAQAESLRVMPFADGNKSLQSFMNLLQLLGIAFSFELKDSPDVSKEKAIKRAKNAGNLDKNISIIDPKDKLEPDIRINPPAGRILEKDQQVRIVISDFLAPDNPTI